MFLCCDLGGSIGAWGIFDPDKEKLEHKRQFENTAFPHIYLMMDQYLSEVKGYFGEKKITRIVIGAAGPIDSGMVKITNNEGWTISEAEIEKHVSDHGFPEAQCVLINDFAALGYGVIKLERIGITEEDYLSVHGRYHPNERSRSNRESRSLICGPGEGLGIASIINSPSQLPSPIILTSEGGHHTFAAESPDQFRLLYPNGEYGEIKSYEQFLSKRGLVDLYNHYLKHSFEKPTDWDADAKSVMERAKTGSDQAASDAVEVFAEILANFCGNSVLTFNCNDTVYLWGGVVRDLSKGLLTSRFKTFYPKRREHRSRVDHVPVVLLQNPDIPLLGCAYRAEQEALAKPVISV